MARSAHSRGMPLRCQLAAILWSAGVKAVETHEMAGRSAVLMTLSNQDAMTVTTPDGRAELKKELKQAVNEVLKEKEGFGGIDDVYFTSFVVQ